jgi:hypothetical protein
MGLGPPVEMLQSVIEKIRAEQPAVAAAGMEKETLL